MKNIFNNDFFFLLMDVGSTYSDFSKRKSEASAVLIPHDWAVGDVDLFYKDATGFYVKDFAFESGLHNNKQFIRFDGIYMDSTIYLNGTQVGEWKYGYTSFVVEITDYLKDGLNELCVKVDYRCPNSRWYSGAGIYRNVWFIETEEVYIPDGGIYVHSARGENDKWDMTVRVSLSEKWNQDVYDCDINLFYNNSNVTISEMTRELDEENNTLNCLFEVDNPDLWDIYDAKLYELKVDLKKADTQDIIQTEAVTVGFRDIQFTTDRGLFVNDKHIKLNGVCEHHDLGALGAAFYEDAFERKLDKLMTMGVNAIRTSHNPVAPEVYDLCDKKGILVLAEAFDMWENAKTEYDYARFFKDWYKKDVERWTFDARNHPSVFMWSIGNEIPDTHAGPRGRVVAAELTSEVKKHDPLGNAKVSFGSNYMPWENTQKVADDMKYVGYNYAESFYEEHHEAHPDWIIYGSETSSIVYSRGVYHFPLAAGILSEDDYQCSALGNSTTSWGAKSIESCISVDAGYEFSLGQFLWTGFDYIGEPTPYHTKNSYFGQIDTAGFPKDPYYMWRAAWTDVNEKPMVHIYPYWSFNEGQMIDIRVCTNAQSVELFLNGESLGRKSLDVVAANFQAPYKSGELLAIAYDENGNEVARDCTHSFGDTKEFVIDQKDYGRLSFFEISAIDADGYPVHDACDKVDVTVTGGMLLGLDNGDSTDYDSYKGSSRRLFRGKLLAIVMADEGTRPSIMVEASKDFVGVREINLEVVADTAKKSFVLTPDNSEIIVKAKLLPTNATDKNITFNLTDIHGNDTFIAECEVINLDGDTAVKVKALGDGEIVLRAVSNDMADHVRVISQLGFEIKGLGHLYTDPYTFVSGSTYTRAIGEITNGNERGIATARDADTAAVFDGLDFGPIGSEYVTIPVFALTDDEYLLQIYDGVYGEECAELICDGIYCKPSIWNTYQPETFHLDKVLKGIKTISIRAVHKFHIKGFTFEKLNPFTHNMWAGNAVDVYGDQFEKTDKCIENIGNNVTVEFGEYEFKDISSVTIYGRAHNGVNTLHVRLISDETELKKVVEFKPTDDYSEQTFELTEFVGKGKLSIIFLPGCHFDLGYIKFD